MSRRIRLQLSGELLRSVLEMPEGIRIVAAEVPRDHPDVEMMELTLEGEQFPQVEPGQQPPLANASTTWHRQRVEWTWGLDASP